MSDQIQPGWALLNLNGELVSVQVPVSLLHRTRRSRVALVSFLNENSDIEVVDECLRRQDQSKNNAATTLPTMATTTTVTMTTATTAPMPRPAADRLEADSIAMVLRD